MESHDHRGMPEADYRYDAPQGSCAHAYLLPLIKKILQELNASQRVLDMGCGNGFVANEISKLGFEVHGVDRSPSGIQIARQTYPQVQFSLGDVETAMVPDLFASETFDAVVSTEVVEHVYNPRRFADNAFRLLKPSGSFVVSTPYHGYAKNLMLALTGKFDRHFTALWDGGHIKFWSRNTLSNLLLEKGFTDLKFLGAGRTPYVWKSMILVGRKPVRRPT